ncbi:MAG: DsbA family protein [Rubrivivax sp.]|nr:DsbA family protein [Rubrivivax sp.]
MRSDDVQRDAVRTAAFHWLADHNLELARTWAPSVFRAYFVDDRNIASIEVLLDLASALGIDAGEFQAAIHDGASRQRLKAEIERAEVRGVFASPLFIVEGERFRDITRLPQLQRWLESGPY